MLFYELPYKKETKVDTAGCSMLSLIIVVIFQKDFYCTVPNNMREILWFS